MPASPRMSRTILKNFHALTPPRQSLPPMHSGDEAEAPAREGGQPTLASSCSMRRENSIVWARTSFLTSWMASHSVLLKPCLFCRAVSVSKVSRVARRAVLISGRFIWVAWCIHHDGERRAKVDNYFKLFSSTNLYLPMLSPEEANPRGRAVSPPDPAPKRCE